MKPKLEAKFEAIAEDTRKQADAIPCSLEDFIEGIGIIIETLRESQQAAEECAKQ